MITIRHTLKQRYVDQCSHVLMSIDVIGIGTAMSNVNKAVYTILYLCSEHKLCQKHYDAFVKDYGHPNKFMLPEDTDVLCGKCVMESRKKK